MDWLWMSLQGLQNEKRQDFEISKPAQFLFETFILYKSSFIQIPATCFIGV